ncbi:RING finger protein 17-like isoform X2 [Haliotis rufescens]|uniref:RING finger protein 17-like isoform X2 n=1 Tax=Haliotis rufescens TaxID=6454 RepID=UPI00201F51F6|nr:RING finger protein 17-like isoform X2 [Haliotis rufescens]
MQKGASCPRCQHTFAVKFRDHRGISRQPLLLKCSHTFCESCLLKLAREGKKGITCPTCKDVTDLPQGETGVRRLPSHYFLSGYLICSQKALLEHELSRMAPAGMASVNKKAAVAEATGRVCSECRLNRATCKCVKCDCVMCGLCFDKVHSLSNTLKQHQAAQITDEDDCPFEDMSPLCKLHGKPIEYFCDDDDTAICSRCVIMGDHKEHSITSMEEKNKVLLGDMEPALQFASQVVKKLVKADKILSQSVPSVKSETSRVIDSIRAHFQSLHAALQVREAELIEEVFTVYQDGVAPLVQMKAEMLNEKRKLDLSIKAAQRIMNNNNEMILNAKDILDSLNRAKDLMCVLSSSDPGSESGIRFEGGDSLFKSFKNYGSVKGEVPKRVMFHTLNDAPEEVLNDDTDTASVVSCSSLTSGTDVTSVTDTGEDVIIEDEQDILVEDEDGNKKSTYVLKPVPGREKMTGHCENVLVTHIRSPCQFYVQRCALNAKLVKMSKALKTWCKGLATEKDIPTDVKKGDFVLCQYSGDKQWYRARVLSVMTTTETNQKKVVTKKHVEVLYFDFGNHEVVTMDKLKNMEARFMKHPEFLMECALHDIEPAEKDGVWSLESASTMQTMIANKPMLMNVIREVGNVLQVDLHKPSIDNILDDRPISLRDSLVFLELARFVTSSERISKSGSTTVRGRDFMKPEPRQRGETFEALVTYSGVPSSFCVQPIGDEAEYLSALMNEMATTYSDGTDLYTVFCPQVDMICVVQSMTDQLWYRARVIDLPGGKQVDVQYVDFGNIECVPYQRIKKILDGHLKLPPLAVQCELSDVEPADPDGSWVADGLEWWTDLTTFQSFQVKILEVQVDAVEVVLYRILDDSPDNLSVNYQLVANGYAKSTGVGSTVLGPSKNPAAEAPKKIFTYRASRQDKQQASSDIAASYMTTSPVKGDFQWGNPPSRSYTPGTTTPVTSKPTTPAITPTKTPPPQNTNRNNMNVNAAAAQAQAAATAVAATQKQGEAESHAVNIKVNISAYESPANFHIQLEETREREGIMRLLQRQFQTSEPAHRIWKVNDFCAARYSKDNLWYRAKVCQMLDTDEIKVYLVDFGLVDTLTSADLRVLDVKMRAPNCCAIQCHLADIVSAGCADPLQWSATACEFMAEMVKNKTLYIKKEGDMENERRSLPIDLLVEEIVAETALEPCRTSVNSLIKSMKEKGLAIPCRRKKQESGDSLTSSEASEVKADEPYVECEVLHYSRHPVPETSHLTVIPTYVDFNGIMYCQCLDDETDLMTMTDDIQTMYVESSPQRVRWQIGQACVSYFKTDDLWFRARVVELNDDKINVQYCDYGNSELQSVDLVRLPEARFVEKPQLCLECVLHGVIPVSEDGTWPMTVLDYIHSMIVNHQCQIEIMKAEEGSSVEVRLKLPDGSDLGKTLIQIGAATPPDDLAREYETSRKISDVIQKRYPYKQPCLAPVGEYFPVVVTHMELPNIVWFQHVAQEPRDIDDEVVKRVEQVNSDLAALLKMSPELAQAETMGKSFIKVPAPGQMCSAQFSYDGCWYRGLVIDRDEDTQLALVVFVDYGNVEYVHLDRLRVLTASARGLAGQGVRSYLHGLQPVGGPRQIWCKNSMVLNLQLIGNQPLVACIKALEPLSVELYKKSCDDFDTEHLELAYQQLIESGLAQIDPSLAEESELFDLAVTASLKEAEIGADVIIEEDTELKEDERVTE